MLHPGFYPQQIDQQTSILLRRLVNRVASLSREGMEDQVVDISQIPRLFWQYQNPLQKWKISSDLLIHFSGKNKYFCLGIKASSPGFLNRVSGTTVGYTQNTSIFSTSFAPCCLGLKDFYIFTASLENFLSYWDVFVYLFFEFC